jgi:hypothetical protein
MGERGRKSLAEIVYEKAEDDDPVPEKNKLVLYDFEGTKIPKKFYLNLRGLFKLANDGFMAQYSAAVVEQMRTARAIKELAQKCGRSRVRIYAVEELE